MTGNSQVRTRSSCAGSISKCTIFGMGREAARISGDAIVETRAEDQQQIGFVQRHIGGAGPVHANHAQVIRRILFHRAQTVNGGEGWNIQMIQQLSQFGDRAGELGARPDKGDGLLGLLEQGERVSVKVDSGPTCFADARRREIHRAGNSVLALIMSVGISMITGPGRRCAPSRKLRR